MHRIWTAADGTSVVIRPIRPDDFSLTKEFDDRLSPATKYRRLMSERQPSSAELRRFTHIDARREVALIAIVGDPGSERQIGVARCVDDDAGESAEFAVVVSDDWQQRGLGAVLLSALIDAARLRGVQRLEAITMAENRGMLNLAHKLGFSARQEPGEPKIIELVLNLL
jgi:RimJ/RimL family protein N-acetyltransferase